MNIQKDLFKLQDKKYKEFHCKIIPTIEKDRIIGVRVPEVRKYAKQIKNMNLTEFMNKLPHDYYDEDMLHGILISEIKDYDLCIKELDKFLPYINNWAVCDITSPKVFKKNKDKLINKIIEWTKSKDIYTCRFGIEMLMSHYLDEDFKEEYLKIPSKVKSDEYYIKMMVAWFFATALSKKWDETIKYLENNTLNIWTHNKTIQKCCESYRISDQRKKYLRTLKR